MMFREPTTAQEVRDLAARVHRAPPTPVVVLPRKILPSSKRDWLFVSTRQVEPSAVAVATRLQLRDAVLAASGHNKDHFTSPRRDKPIVQARFAFYWLCAEYTTLSYPQIGQFVGRRDHTTIMAAFQSKNMYAPRTCKIINDVMDALKLPVPERWAKQGSTE